MNSKNSKGKSPGPSPELLAQWEKECSDYFKSKERFLSRKMLAEWESRCKIKWQWCIESVVIVGYFAHDDERITRMLERLFRAAGDLFPKVRGVARMTPRSTTLSKEEFNRQSLDGSRCSLAQAAAMLHHADCPKPCGSVVFGCERRSSKAAPYTTVLSIDWDCSDIYPHLHEDGSIVIVINTELFEADEDTRRCLDTLMSIIANDGEPYALFCDIGLDADHASGLDFGRVIARSSTNTPRIVERFIWKNLGEKRRDKIRRVAVANLLTKQHLAKLGGPAVLQEYREYARAHLPIGMKDIELVAPLGTDEQEGVIVWCAPFPSDMFMVRQLWYDRHQVAMLAAWWHCKLREADLLI